jgi:hypothetical protein
LEIADVKTEELIVQLTRSLEPVQPLPSPFVRLIRWAALSFAIATLGVLAIGARADVADVVREPAFAALAMLAIATGIAAAASAFVLSVPGAERSPAQRAVPFVLFGGWVALLAVMLVSGGAALERLLALPVHALCIIEIAGFAFIPGWALFNMLRRAAPLKRTWTAVFAALAATALGAAATQILCPLDDPAHYLMGHIAPAVVFTVVAATARQRSLIWLR